MLSGWLDGSVDAFKRQQWGKVAFARPGAAKDVVERCRWSTLCEILGRSPDVVVAERGRQAQRAAPVDREGLHACFREGRGLVVRRAEHHDEGLADLAASIGREIGGDVHIQLFATPGGHRMFGWHFDAEQVIVVQTEGSKEYLLRRNTVCRSARFDRDPPFARVAEEASEVMAVTMWVGDWLHIPSPWWHIAEALEPSLHISIGVLGSDPERARFRRFR